MVALPQPDARMIPASARLHAAIVEGRLTPPKDAELARHASDAIARHSRRGWRIDKPNPRANIGSMIALAMAVERAEQKPEPVKPLGWAVMRGGSGGSMSHPWTAPHHGFNVLPRSVRSVVDACAREPVRSGRG